jgi:hypothetical protein
MTPADLEAAYWRLLPRAGPAVITALTGLAEAYADTQRRAALDAALTVREQRASVRATHLDEPGATGHHRAACRVATRHHRPLVTSDPAAVTCHSCMATAAQRAAVLGVAS